MASADRLTAAAREKPARTVVAKAVQRWRSSATPSHRSPLPTPPQTPAPEEAPALPRLEDVLVSMPRRKSLITPTSTKGGPQTVTAVRFRASFFTCVRRLLKWLGVVADVLGGRLRDRLTGQNTAERRARRLRKALERVGGTFVKFGQQISMRIDVVPWEYCVELSKMLDQMQPFPFEQALAAIERSAGRPWRDVFSTFDPEPVGSASIACVYQALLKDGTKVAVKVRRPGIGEVFVADFRVLDWLFGLVEWLAIVRPGFTANLRREFRETLLEELNFTKEARFQHIFRQNARRRSGEDFFKAPSVYFELSNEEVIVQEFVSGMWLWEVIAAVEQRDSEGHALMQRLNIDPGLVARRLLWVAFWSQDENLFFHADPHPANIVIGADSTLTFIDFGSCGSFDDEQRWAIQRLSSAMQADDPEGMARATLKLLAPFPPLDVTALMKEAQAEYVRVLYTFRTKAKHTQWWERTSARQWLALVKVARQFNLPVNVNTLRMIRGTLLYDTLVMRLDPHIDRYKEHAKFTRGRARWARARWKSRVREAGRQFMLRSEEMVETGGELLDHAQHILSSPAAGFTSVIDKGVFAVSVLTRMIARVLVFTAIAAGWVASRSYLRGGDVPLSATLQIVAQSNVYRFFILLVVAVNIRHILFRFRERDVRT